MLIQFRVENHRSLRDEQTLSLVAATSTGKDDARLIRAKGLDEALLPTVALYGANASGKSNVLGALDFMRTAVLRSHRFWEPDGGVPQEPFSLSSKAEEPSLYEVDVLIDGVRYQYGFIVSADQIEREWLSAWPLGREQSWFVREGIKIKFGKHLLGENETIRELTRPNSLFLSAAAQNNHALLLPLFRWFQPAQFDLRRARLGTLGGMARVAEDDVARQLALSVSDEATSQERNAIVRLLQAADTGILDFKIEVEEADLFPSVQRGITRRVRRSLSFRHRAEDAARAWLPFAAESDGTVTLLSIATRLVRALRTGGLLCVDELDASLHPMLALDLLRLFHDPRQNLHGAQLIFTTHDTNLLGNVAGEPPLRRDQIWFTEKDQSGATKLYPLTDFHPRKEENLERGYLQGRYGAVPFLGELIAAPTEPEGE